MENWQTKEFKNKIASQLSAENLNEYQLIYEDDTRLYDYILELQQNPDAHNLFELLAAIRFLRFQRQYVWRWEKVRNFITLYEILPFSGLSQRQTYKMTCPQAFWFATIKGFYEWVYTGKADKGDNEITETRKVQNGRVYELRRLCKTAIFFVPRKNSKTTSVASLAVEEFLMGDNNAQAYTAANSYKQAQICFKEISKILRPFDPKKNRFKITRENIRWRETNDYGRESIIECMSGGAETKDGLNASLVIYDEYAAAKYTKDHSEGAELLQVLTSSMGVRKEPMVVIITTASRVPNGPFRIELDNAMRTLLGEIDNDSLSAFIFQPDAWEGADSYGNPDLWRKVHPHIGVMVEESFYHQSWKKAQNDAESMIEFKTKLLNVFSSASVQDWISLAKAQSLQSDFELSSMARLDTMCAIDLSVHDDMSAVVYTAYHPGEYRFYVWAEFFIPEETIYTHPNRQLYQQWVNDGYLNVCPGAVISEDMIVADVLEKNQHLRILRIGYDSYKSQEVVNAIGAAIASQGGNPSQILKAVPQTYGAFTSPVESFELAVYRNPPSVVLCNNPILAYNFSNCYIDEDHNGNKKPLKRSANLKIDGAIATLMTFWLFNNTEQ
jgi:phage terminase large subunit-like protein